MAKVFRFEELYFFILMLIIKAKKIWFDDNFIYVETTENKQAKMQLAWFPRLQKATNDDLQKFELWADGSWIHWEVIGEDLSVEGFFTFKKETIQSV